MGIINELLIYMKTLELMDKLADKKQIDYSDLAMQFEAFVALFKIKKLSTTNLSLLFLCSCITRLKLKLYLLPVVLFYANSQQTMWTKVTYHSATSCFFIVQNDDYINNL